MKEEKLSHTGEASKTQEDLLAAGTISLRQVASAAGVSTATVSRAVNRPEAVSPKLRERIRKAIDQLGWIPSGAARALATRRTTTIGAVFPAMAAGDFACAIDALQEALTLRNHTLLLARSKYDLEQERLQVMKLIERGVDGLVLVGQEHHPALYPALAKLRIPVINTFVYPPQSDVACIGPDNKQALAQMTEYLVELGHRHFAMIAQSTLNNDRARARWAGVVDTLANHGLAIPPSRIAEGHWTIAEGREMFRRIFAGQPHVTALICGNSVLSVGAMLESQSMGITVPGDLSIVGYDDIEIMAELPIPITTVRVRSDQIGRRAAGMILDMIERGDSGQSSEIAPELIVRGSSGPPPRGI